MEKFEVCLSLCRYVSPLFIKSSDLTLSIAFLDDQGAIIVVSHDEAFVNKLLTGTISGVGSRDPSVSALHGELWVLERQQFRRFEGSFRQYKNKVLQTIQKELKF